MVDHTIYDTSSLDITSSAFVMPYEKPEKLAVIYNNASTSIQTIIINDLAIVGKELNQGYELYEEMLAYSPWIKEFLAELKNLNEPKLLFPYYEHIQTLMYEKNFHTFSTLLNNIKMDELNETMMIGLLRLSNPWKSKISAWSNFLNKAHIELTIREHSSQELLRGLS